MTRLGSRSELPHTGTLITRAYPRAFRRAGFIAAMFLLVSAGGCKKSGPASPATSESAPAGTAAAPAPGQAPAGSLADRLNAIQSGQADGTGKPVLPDWKAAQPGAAAVAIPLVKGLVVVTAITDPRGDYESIKSIEDMTPKLVQLHYSADKPTPKMTGLLGGAEKGLADPKNEFPDKVVGTRLIDPADLANAHSYSELFANKTEHYPGSTAIGASTEMLNQLRAGQQVEFHFAPESQFAIFMQIGAQVEGHKADQPTLTQHAGMPMYSCMLHRVETTDLAVPVLLNDRRVELPALHAMCTLDDNQEAHIYYLDQPANPLTLAFQLGPLSSRLQAIKIMLPPPEKAPTSAPAAGGGGGDGGGGAQMEADLAAKKPVEIYGIYFDFNSATIKPESEAVLQEIAGIMQKDPDWKLDVRGHTDNVGDDSFNLGLSQRRAAAVKDALVRRYKIPPDHLATSGYGASQPIETNKTMEGRARNRRVELQRQ
jgi:outer membrane protein OmpA-like peptidoglycan-associated protein